MQHAINAFNMDNIATTPGLDIITMVCSREKLFSCYLIFSFGSDN
jgi:hypothetical protein